MKTSTMVKLGISAVAALIGAAFMYQGELKTAAHARKLVAEGTTVTAEVTGATTKSRKKYGFTTSKSAEVDYSFETADGQIQNGHDSIEVAALEAMTDPTDSSLLLDDAAVEILYMPTEPSDNGIKSALVSHQSPDLLTVALIAVFGGAIAYGILARLSGFLAVARSRLAA
ncbi:hypothetical protein ACSV9I_09015 [Rhizobium sp. G187]|uniref:hypothetical protein n=1 Tax=Rhizobium sp. G187 TaxID=3451352 RepID=UPI003EE504F8